MKNALLRGCAALLACTGASANAAGILDNYSFEWSKAIATKEGSAVAYNWDLKRLMVTNDEEAKGSGTNYFATLGEYDMNGNFLATITINGCQTVTATNKCDPEGLTYIGNNTYVVGSERIQDMFKVTSASTSGDREYTGFDTAPQISFGADAGNSGLEGVAYNKVTGEYWGVKETNPQAIYRIGNADWVNETGTVTNPFNISALGFATLSDIAVLSNGGFSGSTANNLLILSGTSQMIKEVTQSGTEIGSYSLASFKSLIDPTNAGGKFEGMTLDDEGNIYLVSDDGNGPNQSYLVKLKYNAPAVPEPASWALMIAGFGLVGAGMRRRKVAVRFA
ncbi:MAG TPA: SdiA-regulated domain-containing protein [Sphingobium sp.]